MKTLMKSMVMLTVFWASLNISAYTSVECPGTVTTSGEAPRAYETCASDDLPFGTRVYVGDRCWVVNDRFGGGYTGRLDLFYGSDYDGALQWGRRQLMCRIETP